MTIPEPPIWIHDAEVYSNYYLMGIKRLSGATLQFESWPGKALDIDGITRAIQNQLVVTFNGINYDMPILSLALAGADNVTLKRASDAIIVGGLKWWQVRDTFGGVDLSGLNHIDLMPVAPGRSGLKTYAARMHSRNLQELPIDPAALIRPEDRAGMRQYNGYDLDKTIDLYHTLKPQLELRDHMTAQYGIDLRSKSDAQIAEAIIKSELDGKVYPPIIEPGTSWLYRAPDAIRFQTEGLRRVLDTLQSERFVLDAKYEIAVPAVLQNLVVCAGSNTYTVGMGGLHSREKSVATHATPDRFLCDTDVNSYYPNLMLTLGIYPSHLGPDFLRVFAAIVKRRLEAKADPLRAREAATLKIVVNGTFGKLGSHFSIFFSPENLTRVTLTGQLYLLMLIESLELSGFTVVSANTDGVVVTGPRSRQDAFAAIVRDWELRTGLTTEKTPYKAIYEKDVNNYVAVKEDDHVKLKGLYSPSGLAKNPANAICRTAVVDYLVRGVPIEQTVGQATRLTDFITARKVEEGAAYLGQSLGKGVRWYYGYGDTRITGSRTGNLVPRSEGAIVLLDLPADAPVPANLNRAWYVQESRDILGALGATVPNT